MFTNKPFSKDIARVPLNKEAGFHHEHILISATVSHTDPISQYDDSLASKIARLLEGWAGVLRVEAHVLYDHCRTDTHALGCACDECGRVYEKTLGEEQKP